jgi:hypothetical protein
MGSFVQFDNAADVLEAYENRGIAVWSIFQGKELLSAGEGREELEGFLQMLEKSRHPVVYTLKVYNAVNDPNCITNKTESNGGFKFQVEGASAGAISGPQSGPRYAGADLITQRIHSVISDKVSGFVDDLLSGKTKEEPKPKLKDVLIGYLENPEDLQAVLGSIGSVVAMFKGATVPGMVAGPRIPERFAGATDTPEAVLPESAEEREKRGIRLACAVNRLEKCDPDIVEHLEQLATIAETKPALYKTALGFLS